MGGLTQDIKYALRMLRKAPGFTAIAVLTLAIGIGANAAIFSVVDAVLLRPLPFNHPEQLVAIKDDLPGLGLTDEGMSQPELDDLEKRSGVFDQVSAVWPINANVTGAEKPERVEAQGVSFNYFTLLGAKVELGRVIQPEDHQLGFAEAAVISDSLWRGMFGADPGVIGRPIRLDSDLYRIVGVMPPGFRHPGATLEHDVDVWVAAGFVAAPFPVPPSRAIRMIPGGIGRLKPGLTIAKAQAQLDAFTTQLRAQYPADYPESVRWTIRLVPLQKEVVGNSNVMLIVLLGSVSLVLLIACVNIASLLLARSSSRYREIAVRRALGASRGRLIRQTLTESIVLSLAGGVIGLLLNSWLTGLLLRMVPSNLPRAAEVGTDSRVLLFALGLSILTGVLFGLAPAAQLSDPRLVENLKEGTRGSGIGSRQNRFLSALVVSEFALSLVMLVGAGLLLRSFWNLLEVHPGFSSSHVVLARVWLPVPNDPKSDPYRPPEKRAAFVREVARRVTALPGVVDAAIGSNSMPFLTQRNRGTFTVEGRPVGSGDALSAEFATVSPDFFGVLGTPLIRGRFFTDSDDTSGQLVVLIDQTAAERFWPNEDPVGKRLLPGFLQGPNPKWLTIAGVVGKTKTDGLDAPYEPHIYFSEMQFPGYALDVYIRTNASPDSLAEPIRREVQSVDPNLPVFGVRTLDSVVTESLASRRFAMRLIVFFAGTALLLAGVGIYGVMAYFVSQRTREIGIRVALGAAPGHISRLILGRGMALTAAGILFGIIGATALTRFLATLIFGVAPMDPLTFVMGAVVLGGVALAACYIPARRAMRVDPMVALRYE
ncbi:MAG TPA: ABC transporter permease [Candidatus Acidoferrales bacterium]